MSRHQSAQSVSAIAQRPNRLTAYPFLVGDLVKVGSLADDDLICSSPFGIVSISTYGHETPVLDRMWTGTLTVQGVPGGNLFDGQMFVREPESLKIAPTFDHDHDLLPPRVESFVIYPSGG